MMLRALLAGVLCLALNAFAEDSTDAEARGRELAAQLLAQRPAEDYTNHGVIKIKAEGRTREIPLRCTITVTATNWLAVYDAALSTNQTARLCILHEDGRPDEYYYRTNQAEQVPLLGDIPVLSHLYRSSRLSDEELTTPLAGSDFWAGDLGVSFLHWPGQKLLKKEIKRSQGCTVLESTNPRPSAGGYARVVSWIESEHGGFVQAFAYDVNDQKLKEFYPEDVKKVNGQWQVGRMEMDNDQTGSRTRLEFDLDDDSPKK